MRRISLSFFLVCAAGSAQTSSDLDRLAKAIEAGRLAEADALVGKSLRAIEAKTNPPLTLADAKDTLFATPDKTATAAAAMRSRQAFDAKDWRTAYRELRLAQKGLVLMSRDAGAQGRLGDARRNTAMPGSGFAESYKLAIRAYEAGAYLEAMQSAEGTIRQLNEAHIGGLADFAHRALTLKGAAQLAMGDVRGAERSLAESLENVQADFWKANLGPRLTLVKLFLERGQTQPAIQFFARAAAKFPGYRDKALGYKLAVEAGRTPAFDFLELAH